MAAVIWSDQALDRLDLIISYIEQFDPPAAGRLAARLIDASQSLTAFPNRGRPASQGTRELVTVRPYVIRYKVEGDRVLILGIRHAAQLSEAD